MRRVIGILGASLVVGALLLWGVERFTTVAAEATAAGDAGGELLTLAVPSLSCGSCEGRIRAALEGQPGVKNVAVDLGSHIVQVVYDPGAADPKALADTVTRAGYPARYLPPGVPLPTPRRGGGGCGSGCCQTQG